MLHLIMHVRKSHFFQSGGDLEYNENFASIFYQMVKGIDKGILSLSDNESGFKKLSSELFNYFMKCF